MKLVTHCAPFSAMTRHGALLVQPQVTLNSVHSSVSDEAYNCLHPWVRMYRPPWPVLHQLLCFQAAPLGPSLTSHLRELSIRDRFPRKRSSRGGRRKQRRIAVIRCVAAREPVAKRCLKVVPCDPCPASPLPPSQPPTASSSPVLHCRPTYRLLHPLRHPLHCAGFLVRHCCPTYHFLHHLRRPLRRAGFLVRHCCPTYHFLHPLRRPLRRAGFLVHHCRPTYRLLHPLRRPLHHAGFLVHHCRPTYCLLHPLRCPLRLFPLHRVGFLVQHCCPTHLHPLRHPLHRAGFLVRHCCPTDLHPLRHPLHHAGFLMRHCRPTDTPLYSIPAIVLISRCETAVLWTASSLCYNIPSTVLFPHSAEHASHDMAGKCKLCQSGHSYSTA